MNAGGQGNSLALACLPCYIHKGMAKFDFVESAAAGYKYVWHQRRAILPLVTIGLFLVQTKLFSPPPTDDQQRTMQRVMTLTMAFMGILFFKVPSGLCVYFITSSIWGIVERQLIPKPQIPEGLASLDGDKSKTVARVESSPEPYLTSDQARQKRRRSDRERQRRLRESQQ